MNLEELKEAQLLYYETRKECREIAMRCVLLSRTTKLETEAEKVREAVLDEVASQLNDSFAVEVR